VGLFCRREMSKNSLTRLFNSFYQDVSEYLLIVENEINRFISDDCELAKMCAYTLNAGGKRIRPLLLLLACEAVNGNIKNALSVSAAVELAHTMGLIQDDIFDNAETRRGKKPVHIVWGIHNAILASDFLFLKSVEAVTSLANLLKGKEQQVIEILNLFVKAGLKAIEGEYLDLIISQRKIASIEECLEVARKKTGAFIKVSLEAGAIIGNAAQTEREALSEYGDSIGVAYQLADDILGLTSLSQTLGKEIGSDIRNGKITVIIAHCLNTCSESQKRAILRTLGNREAEKVEVEEIIEILKECGSIDYAYGLARNYASEAKKKLETLPQTRAKQILGQMAELIVSRQW